MLKMAQIVQATSGSAAIVECDNSQHMRRISKDAHSVARSKGAKVSTKCITGFDGDHQPYYLVKITVK